MGGNGTHIGSTANVYIVTISERLAKKENDPSLAITPRIWFRYGTPAMLATLLVSSLIIFLFFGLVPIFHLLCCQVEDDYHGDSVKACFRWRLTSRR